MNPKLTPEIIMEAAQREDSTGFCVECGNEQGMCEPDARERICDNCGMAKVYGAEEILIQFSAADWAADWRIKGKL